MKIFIKNMVCSRCVMMVKEEFNKLGIDLISIALGEVETSRIPDEADISALGAALASLGFEIYDDKKTKLISKVKLHITELLDDAEFDHSITLSEYLASEMHQEYSAISSIFSYLEDTTIEQYYITQKIERVKENIMYSDLSLSAIADKMGYSSIAHLSTQFKKVTGLTPSYFKAVKEEKMQLKQ